MDIDDVVWRWGGGGWFILTLPQLPAASDSKPATTLETAKQSKGEAHMEQQCLDGSSTAAKPHIMPTHDPPKTSPIANNTNNNMVGPTVQAGNNAATEPAEAAAAKPTDVSPLISALDPPNSSSQNSWNDVLSFYDQ